MIQESRTALIGDESTLPDSWEWCWLDDVMTIRGGAQPPASEFASQPSAGFVRFVQIRDFDTDSHITYIPDSPKWRKCTKGEVLIARYGASLGRILRGIEGAYNVALVKALPKKNVDNGYLFYLLKSDYFQLPLLASGGRSAQEGFNKGDLAVIRVPLPPLPIQRRIADILGSLDDKIELNRRTNETLEAMARTLFRSWFVDFDPVRAKADGQKPQGMDAATAKLFPDSFEPSAIGPIPKGWRVAPLGEFVEVAKGLSYKGDGLAPVGLPLHNLNSVYEGGGYKHEGIKHYIGEYRPVHVARAGDLIVTNTEQGHDHLLIGYSAIVPKRYGNDGLFSHHIFRVRPLPSSSLTSQFIHHMLLTPRFRGEVIGFSNGTTVNMLHADGLKKPRLVLPPDELIQRFTEFAESLSDKAESNRDQSRTLAATRDALLPKLLSGEVRVTPNE